MNVRRNSSVIKTEKPVDLMYVLLSSIRYRNPVHGADADTRMILMLNGIMIFSMFLILRILPFR